MPVAKKKKLIARKDPKSRPMNGAQAWGALRNPDPTKKYVAVYMNDDNQGPEYYSWMGYTPVEQEAGEDALQWKGGKTVTVGDQLINRGHMLMEIDKDKADDIAQYGPDGVSGQENADAIDEQILDKRGGIDQLRGLHGMGREVGFKFENDIEAPHRE
jgi:hypothetical protein